MICGSQMGAIERSDGVSDEALSSTELWQQREREVDRHVAAGRVQAHESSEDFLAHLDHLDQVDAQPT